MHKFFIISAGLFFSVSNSFAEEASKNLLKILQPIHNLSGSFEQQSLDKNNKLLQMQAGNFVVQKTGEFYWEIDPPYEQKIISDGKIINVYDPDLEQVTIKTLEQKAQIIPLLLFSENGQQLISQYIVSEIGDSSNPVFELKPKINGSLFDRLTITFRSDKVPVSPAQLEIVDSLKQVTRIYFDKTVLNRHIDTKVFLFSAPEGVDVIDERK